MMAKKKKEQEAVVVFTGTKTSGLTKQVDGVGIFQRNRHKTIPYDKVDQVLELDGFEIWDEDSSPLPGPVNSEAIPQDEPVKKPRKKTASKKKPKGKKKKKK